MRRLKHDQTLFLAGQSRADQIQPKDGKTPSGKTSDNCNRTRVTGASLPSESKHLIVLPRPYPTRGPRPPSLCHATVASGVVEHCLGVPWFVTTLSAGSGLAWYSRQQQQPVSPMWRSGSFRRVYSAPDPLSSELGPLNASTLQVAAEAGQAWSDDLPWGHGMTRGDLCVMSREWAEDTLRPS